MMAQFFDFRNTLFKKVLTFALSLLVIVNYAQLLTGQILALLPLALQCAFLFFLACNHRFYRSSGVFVFGIIMLIGVLGLISSFTTALQVLMGAEEVHPERIYFKSVSGFVFLAAIGFLILKALLTQTPLVSQSLSRPLFKEPSTISLRKAVRDSLLIGAVVYAGSALLGVILGLFNLNELVEMYSAYFNISGLIAVLALTTVSVIRARMNLLGQAFFVSFFYWLILLPMNWLRNTMWDWLITGSVFVLQAIIAFIFSLLWTQIFLPGLAELGSGDSALENDRIKV